MSTLKNSGIVLTQEQDAALKSLLQFIVDPNETVMILSGYAGCGKSTLVDAFVTALPKCLQAAALIDPNAKDFEIVLTATTNKAAEALQDLTKRHVATIHSALGLRVRTDYTTGKTKLESTGRVIYDSIVIIDEASYVDSALLQQIFMGTKDCKIIFIGDPAQLTPVMSVDTPVFQAGFPEASLTEVVRQVKGNPIIDLATKFRETVNTGEFFNFTPDGHHIQRLSRDDFNKHLLIEFNRPNWKYQDSKILAWTNKRVVEYNHYVRDNVKGCPTLEVGDYAVCNSYVNSGKYKLKTDQLVQITRIHKPAKSHDVSGAMYTLDDSAVFFMPDNMADRVARFKKAKINCEYGVIATIDNTWIDLRAAYACTVNKSQGSTYDSVYIDLDDISKCNRGDLIARMLYVAVSRARKHVYLTGDLIR